MKPYQTRFDGCGLTMINKVPSMAFNVTFASIVMAPPNFLPDSVTERFVSIHGKRQGDVTTSLLYLIECVRTCTTISPVYFKFAVISILPSALTLLRSGSVIIGTWGPSEMDNISISVLPPAVVLASLASFVLNFLSKCAVRSCVSAER